MTLQATVWMLTNDWVDCTFLAHTGKNLAFAFLLTHWDHIAAISRYLTDGAVCIFLPNVIPLLGLKSWACQRPSSSDHQPPAGPSALPSRLHLCLAGHCCPSCLFKAVQHLKSGVSYHCVCVLVFSFVSVYIFAGIGETFTKVYHQSEHSINHL